MMRRVFENQRLSKNIADQTFLPSLLKLYQFLNSFDRV